MSNTEIYTFNACKKIAQMEKVIYDMCNRREDFFFQVESLKKPFEKEISNIQNDYEVKMTSLNQELAEAVENMQDSSKRAFFQDYERIMDEFNDVFGKLSNSTEETFQNASVELTEFRIFLEKISGEVTKQIAELSKRCEDDIQTKINELNKKYKNEIKTKEREFELKSKTFVEKEEVDGYTILKKYEEMANELKAKFYSKATNDPRLMSTLKNAKDCLMVLEEGVRHARRRLLKLQSVSGSNITSFIQRRNDLIEAYKKDFELYKKKHDELLNSVSEEEVLFNIESSDLIKKKEEDEEAYEVTKEKLKLSLDSLIEANEIELKNCENNLTEDEEVDESLNEMIERFKEEEKELSEASEMSRVTKTKQIEELNQTIEKNKERYNKKMEKYTTVIKEDKERYSIDFEATKMQNKTEKEELIAQNQIAEGSFTQKLTEFRERVDKYNKLMQEKNFLEETMDELIKMRQNNIDVIDKDAFDEIIAKEKREVQIKERDFKQKSDLDIQILSDKMVSEYNDKIVDLNMQYRSEIDAINNHYFLTSDNTEQKESMNYEALKKSLESISIPIIDETEQKAQLKMLQTKRKDIDGIILKEKNDYLEELKQEQIEEDERHQKVLIELLQDDHDESELILLRENAERRMKPLTNKIEKLNNELCVIKATNKDCSELSYEETKDIKDLRFRLSVVRQEGKTKVDEGKKKLKEQKETYQKEFTGKVREIELVTKKKEDYFNELDDENKLKVKKLEEELENTRYLHSKNEELVENNHRIDIELETKKFNEKKDKLNEEIKVEKNKAEEEKSKNEEEAKESQEKLLETLKEAEDHYALQSESIEEKKRAFIEQYDKVIEQRKEKLEIIKEAYRNRPFMPKEQKEYDELTKKKNFLDRAYDFEKRTLRRYNDIGLSQETTFNNRFGNTLILNVNDYNPRRFSQTSSSRRSVHQILPPLRQLSV